MLDSFTPVSPAPASAPSATPVDPMLLTELHIWLAVGLAMLAGVIIVSMRKWVLNRTRDPLCICNDPLSHHEAGDQACSDCVCRCFIERPAA